MMKTLLISLIVVGAITNVLSQCTPACDSQSQTCVNGNCTCNPKFQSDLAGGCCPETLNVTKGLCYLSATMPQSVAKCINFCTKLGAGVNLVTFPTADAYQQLITLLFNNGAPSGAPFVLGMGKVTAAGPPNYDASQDWTIFQTSQPPTYTQFAATQTNPTGTISYFTFNGASANDWTIGSPTDMPQVTYSVQGTTIKLAGFIALCIYYPAVGTTTSTSNSTVPCSGGCGSNAHGYLTTTGDLQCCNSLTDKSCPAGYSCTAAQSSGYVCCQSGYQFCPLPVSFPYGIYYLNRTNSANTSVAGIGDRITFYCNTGYSLVGSQGSLCMANNTWTNSFPTCVGTSQCDVSNISNGALSGCATISGPYYPGARVKYNCDSSTYMQAKNVRTVTYNCDSVGRWTPAFELCRTPCPVPSAPTNGEFWYVGNVNVFGLPAVGSAVAFKCQAGFDLAGPPLITCLSDGIYDLNPPTCEKDDSINFWWWPYIVGFIVAGWGFLCGFGCCCSRKKIRTN